MARLLGGSYGVPGLKAALKLVGYDVGVPRPPLLHCPKPRLGVARRALTVSRRFTA